MLRVLSQGILKPFVPDILEDGVGSHLSYADVEVSVKTLIEQMVKTLACGERIEIRGFGSFAVRTRSPRTGRNPKTGEVLSIPAKRTPHFKAGKQLKARVDTFENA